MQLISERKTATLLAFLLAVAAGSVQAAPAIVEACKSCHAEDGAGVGKANIPVIAGMPAVHIEEALYAYKDGARQCIEEPVMCDTANLLSDENIADLAEHYGSLPRNSLNEDFDKELAAIGEIRIPQLRDQSVPGWHTRKPAAGNGREDRTPRQGRCRRTGQLLRQLLTRQPVVMSLRPRAQRAVLISEEPSMSYRPARLAISLFVFFAGTASADVTLIHAGKLLAVPGEAPASNMTIIVEDDRITGIQEGFVETEGATVIDLRDKFVLPGLMDMHVHLQGQLGPKNDRDALKMSDQLMQMRSIHYAMKTLMAGFTTVRDVGSSS